MHPILLQVGPLRVPTYGFLMACGFLVSFVVAARRSARRGWDPDAVANLFFLIVLSSIAGARVLHVALNVEHYAAAPLSMVMLWRGGLVFFGGLCTAVPASVWYCRRVGLPVAEVADVFAPCVALGHVFGRLGCFAFGCCYGAATTLPWGVVFPGDPTGTIRHPTQLYEALAEFVICLVLSRYERRRPPPGSVMAAYLILYPSVRFFVEFVRADPRGGSFVFGWSIAQHTALLLVLGASVALWKSGRRPSGKD